MAVLELAGFFLGSFAASVALVPVCRTAAHRLGKVARPSADRWHQRPTALLGGVAIVLVSLAAWALIRPINEIVIYAVLGTGIFLVGLADDFINLKPYTKLVAQLVFASAFVFFGYRLQWFSSQAIDAVVTVLWIVGITNALNLLDNMDGLCGGVAIMVGLSILGGLLPVAAARPEALALAAMLGAVAGFLVYNVHPASIFMGDSGSLFLGLMLAGMSLELPRHAQNSNVLAVVFVPLMVMLIPIFDTTLVTLMRLLSGKRPWDGGRDHSSHRLVAIGLPEKQAVMVLWGLAGLGGLAAWGLRQMSPDSGGLAVAISAVAMLLFAAFLTRVKVYDQKDAGELRRGSVTTVVSEFMYKRRVAEVLMDFFLIIIAYYGAYRLRFEGELKDYFSTFLDSLPIVVSVQMVTFFVLGAYRGVWRYFGLMDGFVIAKAIALGSLITQVLVLYLFRFSNYSRAVFIIYSMILLLLCAGTRGSFRLMAEYVQRRRRGHRVVIYGAGNGGALAVREVTGGTFGPVTLLGFIDDDATRHRSMMLGYPVLGGLDSLSALVRGGAVDRIVISTAMLDQVRLSDVHRLCADHQVPVSQMRVSFESADAS